MPQLHIQETWRGHRSISEQPEQLEQLKLPPSELAGAQDLQLVPYSQVARKYQLLLRNDATAAISISSMEGCFAALGISSFARATYRC